ncbi:hypothetical protein DFJ58DRAFT_745000 [Suillus subalutaceus]|uniref:uncharacterized protein n=1 Tax=Suillus subalutaceus TaxID=48586 RepID=UPI001B867116|nr:uncharacterized protein DFJ58DRAFT_745000 [Suillus subalutaceus]KAG1857699.1 hypothetical protein DFJ58DRAFT_745000 [Suillus subalutaceus]
MTISYPICVFIESREQGRISHDYPFYRLVEETIQNVIHCPVVLRHMARSTLKNPDKVAEKRRVQEIIQYIQNTCPTVSGSDSPAIYSKFVEVRAYSGCHSGKDPKSRKIARKHIYLQKRLVDDWVKASTELTLEWYPHRLEGFLLLTVFMKLCLARGLMATVKLAFASEGIDLKVQVHSSGPPCSLDNFLSQWNGWLEFDKSAFSEALPYHRRLRSIAISDRISELALGHVRITYESTGLCRLAAGDWTAFPPVCPIPYNVFQPHCLRMWDSQPMEDPNPTVTEIETTLIPSTSMMAHAGWVTRAKQAELEE